MLKVFLDIETTGLKIEDGDRIVEVAASSAMKGTKLCKVRKESFIA